MAVHAKNPSFAQEQREKISDNIAQSMSNIHAVLNSETQTAPVYISSSDAALLEQSKRQTASDTSGTRKKPRNILIGIHVTEEERAELRKTFCSNGFSLATAYRAAMAYLQQDIEYGKAYLTANGEIRRRQ